MNHDEMCEKIRAKISAIICLAPNINGGFFIHSRQDINDLLYDIVIHTEKSITKWKNILDGKGQDLGFSNCALCQRCQRRGDIIPECTKCPVMWVSGRIGCKNTPYNDWSDGPIRSLKVPQIYNAAVRTLLCAGFTEKNIAKAEDELLLTMGKIRKEATKHVKAEIEFLQTLHRALKTVLAERMNQ